MPVIKMIYEKKSIFLYLEKRNLLKKYKKAKNYILKGDLLTVRFKKRNPKSSNIWYFRINKQFRALGTFDDEGNFIVFEIDNHE